MRRSRYPSPGRPGAGRSPVAPPRSRRSGRLLRRRSSSHRAPTTTRTRRSTISSARCSRTRVRLCPAMPCACWRAATSAPRPSWSPKRWPVSLHQATSRRTSRSLCALPAADLLADALDAAAVPYSLDRRDRLAASVTGRTLLACLRVARARARPTTLSSARPATVISRARRTHSRRSCAAAA